MANEKFDCIVIGGGPAGSSAAYVLAKNDFKVCLIERGDFPGSKNVMGGILYSQPTSQIIPEFYKEAPLERRIIEQQIWRLGSEDALKFQYRNPAFNKEPYNSFSVLRSKFDSWFASKIDGAGVYVIPKTSVTDFITDGDKFIGVKTDRPDGELEAKVIVLAEGANSMLAVKAGLAKPIEPQNVALAVKQILFLQEEKINERFSLSNDEGAAIEILGDITEGMTGLAFLYTNKNTISLGMGCLLSDYVKAKIKPYELIEKLKKHPSIAPLIKNSVVREYLAHLIPEKGYYGIPTLYDNGILVAGDAGSLINSLHREGSNMAMTSGKLAAETIIEASAANDFSKERLAAYQGKLENSFIIKDLRKYKNATSKFHENNDKIDGYAKWATDLAYDMLLVDGRTKREKQDKAMKELIKQNGRLGLLKDAYGLRRFLNES